jgi:hypothetical protein
MSDETTYIDETEEPPQEKFVGLLSKEEHDEIVAFLEKEFFLAESERGGEEAEWKTIRRQRWARPEFEKKNVPWPDSSNVCPPGQMIATNTVFGMTKNSFGTKKPFWSVTALQEKNHDDIEVAKTVEYYLQLLADSEFDLNKRDKDREIQEEADSLGTVFVKIPWTTDKHKVTLQDGTQVDAVFHDGPEWVVFPREDALYRMRTKDIQKARWFAQHIELEEQDVEERFASGKWTEYEDWKGDVRTEPLEHEVDADAISKGIPLQREVWDFYEVYLRWDLSPKDGFWEDLLLIYSRKGGVLVMAIVNPMGLRMVRQFNFIKKSFRLDGAGVGHAGMHMQSELEALHNNRINAVHMTTLKMFIARKNSGIKARETMSPGKIFLVDNVADFKTLEVGEVYPSSLQAESNAWGYLQKATLMSDTMAGFADQTLKSRDSIGMQNNRIRASSGMVGSILEGMEDAYSSLGMMTVFQLVWNKDTVMENETRIGRLTDQQLKDLDKALSIKIEEIPIKLRFSVRTSDAEQTFEARRQNVLSLWSIYTMFKKEQLPLLMQVYGGMPGGPGQPPIQLPQPVKEAALRYIVGTSKLMEKMLEFFGEDETGDFVPPVKLEELAFRMMDMAQEQMLRRMENGQAGSQNGVAPGRSGAPPGLIGQPGMEGGGGTGENNPAPGNAGPQNSQGAPAPLPGTGGFTQF